MAKHHTIIQEVINLGLETDLEKQALQFLNLEQMISLLETRLKEEEDIVKTIHENISAFIAGEDLDIVIKFLDSLEDSPKKLACVDKLIKGKNKLKFLIRLTKA